MVMVIVFGKQEKKQSDKNKKATTHLDYSFLLTE